MLVPVILAGGSGSRLWPLSREAFPKQFLPLIKGQSLFQKTLARVAAIKDAKPAIVVGNESHRFLMAEQIRQSKLPDSAIILEPDFKGTAPAITLAAMQALHQYDHDVFLFVLPADHMITDQAGFIASVKKAHIAAKAGHLVTFGIVPTYPEIGYGYIQFGQRANSDAFHIKRFVEKPDLNTAINYVVSKEYCWNSGMFLFSAALFLQEMLLHEPQIYHAVKASFAKAQNCADFMRPDPTEFARSPMDSIDYAVMEKTHSGVVVPLESAWDDVGAWDALAELYPKDKLGNVCLGDVITEKTTDCFVQANQRLVVAVGVKDLIIVETPDAILVLDKRAVQEVKSVVTRMHTASRKEVIFHQRVSRPWGAFESIDAGERFQVKRITVAIGAKLSLQRHHHRSEHWVVVKGTARVTRGQEVFLLSENQSTYIPIGVDHRLENVGKIPLEIIEVQSGAYLGEDDIVRLDDQYGREQQSVMTSQPVKESETS